MSEKTSEQEKEMLFMQMVMMFQGMALQNLGKVMNPVTNQVERNLEHAKNFIDLLGMLEEKTRGNLNGNEKRLIDHVLFELRMNYVDESQKGLEKTEDSPSSKEEGPTGDKGEPAPPGDSEKKP